MRHYGVASLWSGVAGDRPFILYDQSAVRLQGGRNEKISVGSGAWLGNGALIMADIGEGCVVGAGSVVTKNCDPFWVYAGNPARPVKDRRASP